MSSPIACKLLRYGAELDKVRSLCTPSLAPGP